MMVGNADLVDGSGLGVSLFRVFLLDSVPPEKSLSVSCLGQKVWLPEFWELFG